MTVVASAPLWSPQQQALLQAMGYTVYLEGGALDAPAAEVNAPERVPAAIEIEVAAPSRSAPAPVRREPNVRAPQTPDTAPLPAPAFTAPAAARRSGGLGLPDRLQIALLRASGCNPNDPQTRVLMDSWPLAELRANPAAKRALWPQLRALRRKMRQ